MVGARARQEPVAEERHCDHPGCAAQGEFRAPKSRADLETYFWFCLLHVRQYNRAWNFFKGMSRDEIETYQHDSNTWHRPTWAVGVNPGFGARAVYTFNGAHDDLGAFSRGPRFSGRQARQSDLLDGVSGPLRTAFAVLEIAPRGHRDRNQAALQRTREAPPSRPKRRLQRCRGAPQEDQRSVRISHQRRLRERAPGVLRKYPLCPHPSQAA